MTNSAPSSGPTSYADDSDFAAAALNVEVAITLDDLYLTHLAEHVHPYPIPAFAGPEHRRKRLADYRKISCPSYRRVFGMIWRYSDQYREAAQEHGIDVSNDGPALDVSFIAQSLASEARARRLRTLAVSKGPFLDERLDAHALSDAMLADVAQHSFQVDVGRLVTAAETFGLVITELAPGRRRRLVRGTQRLHVLLTTIESQQYYMVAQTLALPPAQKEA